MFPLSSQDETNNSRLELIRLISHNHLIPWMIFVCSLSGSSSIKVRDEVSGNAYDVGAHDISFDPGLLRLRANLITILVLVTTLLSLKV